MRTINLHVKNISTIDVTLVVICWILKNHSMKQFLVIICHWIHFHWIFIPESNFFYSKPITDMKLKHEFASTLLQPGSLYQYSMESISSHNNSWMYSEIYLNFLWVHIGLYSVPQLWRYTFYKGLRKKICLYIFNEVSTYIS